MDDSDLKFLRMEMHNMIASVRKDLDHTTGELLATQMVLHAVIANHPDRHRLYDVIARSDMRFEDRAAKKSDDCKRAFSSAWYAFRDSLIAAPRES
ncbi:hypothetical protein LVB77_19400 [Lysobacter sp. 5GHs7-4]|uniref:hypothetical protein n=1 Tax=Lysobacter sp. 5GHs7-4 TaxID=2904253 RepID=UPI001E30BE49|nr:hypothetical protein [Lysobacter sp. 5GHs7-4]UHQ22787.1 hypothetical protein LVB77_19400 [Lysobacter sp. 5GHs7-4]